jgi:hypothetical protein
MDTLSGEQRGPIKQAAAMVVSGTLRTRFWAEGMGEDKGEAPAGLIPSDFFCHGRVFMNGAK